MVQLSAAMCNRHGLIASATGRGRTKTLQDGRAALGHGRPRVRGRHEDDLSGMTKPGQADDHISSRVDDLGITWTPSGHPVSFLSLGGNGPGVPVRVTVSSCGPHLLAKVLGANKTQTSSLSLVFHYADEKGLLVLDLADLRAVLSHLTSDEGKAELKTIGGLSSATAGVLLRSIVELEQQGPTPSSASPSWP